MSERARAGLCCPRCKQPLDQQADTLVCVQAGCGRAYPIVAGIPILIKEENSLFSIGDYRAKDVQQAAAAQGGRKVKDWLPGISKNLKSGANFRRFASLLAEATPHPLILVIGGRITGQGMQALEEFPALELVASDVAFGPQTQLIVDGHDIPFRDGFFDGVIAQAVLEHVLDPQRCAAEIHRVLKPGGLVYAETPFMQQVHEGRYDFTRYTRLGHRRLFRWFEEVESGAAGGPGMALAWAWRYFLLSFASGKKSRAVLGGIARLTAFWWKYFDPFLAGKAGGDDAAAAYYFLGRRSEMPLDDCDLVKQYRGAVGRG
jgi:uncharacterized protein YbaR (Trm112 family)